MRELYASLAGLRGDETHQCGNEHLEQSPNQDTTDHENGKDDSNEPEKETELQLGEQSCRQSDDEPTDEKAASALETAALPAVKRQRILSPQQRWQGETQSGTAQREDEQDAAEQI
ncbi:hypothetical protein C444_05676 [Haloarcula japonica DSM 6131]|uniref:Uncharacterized protein n=1 Tax=Haloarcula japonica (strain ATCC 49778 / DSM 6131 / JCM 7785 / NBRC 101032 / NCIMB 13157 / TR-1) TaxID=1227453 RepID=M0LGM5_HALJT|nr:hypothetical protein C444_05676 [Haloarcula japonica DSM 6131]